MRLSSFNTKKATLHSSNHIARKDNISYILDHNNYEYIRYINNKHEFFQRAVETTKLITGRRMQDKAKENFWQEAVINTCEHHTLEDIYNLFKVLNREFNGGFVVAEMAIHKDEGVFIKSDINIKNLRHDSTTMKWFDENNNDVSMEVVSVAPNRDIFYNTEDKKWYQEDTYKNEYNIDNLQKYYNYHAHVIYTKFNMEVGKNVRITKGELSKIQDLTANTLNMKRGKKFSKTKRMEHQHLKKLHDEVNALKKQILMMKTNFLESRRVNEYLKAGEVLRPVHKAYKDQYGEENVPKGYVSFIEFSVNKFFEVEEVLKPLNKVYKDLYGEEEVPKSHVGFIDFFVKKYFEIEEILKPLHQAYKDQYGEENIPNENIAFIDFFVKKYFEAQACKIDLHNDNNILEQIIIDEYKHEEEIKNIYNNLRL